MNKSEQLEREHLSNVHKMLQTERLEISAYLADKRLEIKEDTIFRGEAKDNMDHGEKITFRQIIEEKVVMAENIIKYLKKIDKLIQSPYFGRFDFVKDGESQPNKVYLGIHSFYNPKAERPLIYDWRAPISSIFYNHELGLADYDAPTGKINGEVVLKRQFRIREGEMDFMFESAVNIVDDVLQKELSRASDDGMKNIVATIQRDQNLIIRNDQSSVLIIQGVAGSGKTSIALHRIAFLLYRFKETLSSDDILIISPNKVFASYISNVLPELGEEPVNEIQMETLSVDVLGSDFKFQNFFEQITDLLEKEDESLQERIRDKSSLEFLSILDAYVDYVKSNLFRGRDVIVGGCFVPDWLFDEVFSLYEELPRTQSINQITQRITQKIQLQYKYLLERDEIEYLKKMVTKMHQGLSLRETYINMFTWMNKVNLFKLAKNSKFEYADVFPVTYLKLRLEGKGMELRQVKHLLIDEMQDYTPIQYAVINKLFKCNKTILGDANQSVNPYSSSTAETIKDIFNEAAYMQLNKSYRSTFEIMEFVQRISPNPDLEAMKRHGEKPEILSFKSSLAEVQEIVKRAKVFVDSEFNTLGIICKTQTQAEKLYNELQKVGISVQLLTNESKVFSQGIIVCTAHMAKGLEFDQVIVPGISSDNYFTIMHRSLLYVACTRAMHSLILTHTGDVTNLISTF